MKKMKRIKIMGENFPNVMLTGIITNPLRLIGESFFLRAKNLFINFRVNRITWI